MEFYWIYIVCIMLCSYVKHSSEQSGLPASPCPNMFQYSYDGSEWMGTIQVQGSPIGQTTKLEVMLSLRAQLQSVIYAFILHLIIWYMRCYHYNSLFYYVEILSLLESIYLRLCFPNYIQVSRCP